MWRNNPSFLPARGSSSFSRHIIFLQHSRRNFQLPKEIRLCSIRFSNVHALSSGTRPRHFLNRGRVTSTIMRRWEHHLVRCVLFLPIYWRSLIASICSPLAKSANLKLRPRLIAGLLARIRFTAEKIPLPPEPLSLSTPGTGWVISTVCSLIQSRLALRHPCCLNTLTIWSTSVHFLRRRFVCAVSA